MLVSDFEEKWESANVEKWEKSGLEKYRMIDG